MTEKIKIVLADDHPIVRQGLRQIIENEPDLLIVAECADGESALAEFVRFAPDVMILDIDMPLGGGLGVLRKLYENQSQSCVIVLTVHNEPEFFFEAFEFGAKGYILKDCAVEDIVVAIRAVFNKRNYVSSELEHLLFRRLMPNSMPVLSSLTSTERKVLKLIAEYKTNLEIGLELFISPLTVKTHRRNMSLKLNIEGTNGLMKFALENKQLL